MSIAVLDIPMDSNIDWNASMSIYCTYITFYRGNKLPPFYIGSTSVAKIANGYHGSVCSKEYKAIWKSELKENPYLFKTKILSYHGDRKDALVKEEKFQKSLNVVRSTMYINKSLANINGFFGMKVPKEYHHSFGSTEWNEERKVSHGEKRSEYFKSNKVIWVYKDNLSKHTTKNKVEILLSKGWKLGRKSPDIHLKQETLVCPHCGISGFRSGMLSWHFEHCKYHPSRIKDTLEKEKIENCKVKRSEHEFFGIIYNTFEELAKQTGCSEHLYRKYYKNGVDPTPYFNSRNHPKKKSVFN